MMANGIENTVWLIFTNDEKSEIRLKTITGIVGNSSCKGNTNRGN